MVRRGGRLILAVETSCDDTCAAVVDDDRVLSNVISSRAEAHARYGGVVPEVASRHHVELINPVVDAALADARTDLAGIEVIAVTVKPGLIGALLIGVSTAKGLASSARLPLVGVDHLHGHLSAAFLEPYPLEPPFLGLVASGGHTMLATVPDRKGYELLGSTRDDAAGEALDKAARLLGLGYPGGPAIQLAAEGGDPEAFPFPVAMSRDPGLDFSFSGLKTALAYRVKEIGGPLDEAAVADLAASFEAAVVDQLISKLGRAIDRTGGLPVVLGGGVAANRRLRQLAGELCERKGVRLKLVEPQLCTDNAAMIGAAAGALERIPYPDYLALDAFAR